MTRTLMQALKKAFITSYQTGAGNYIALEHAHALDVLIKVDIQKEINRTVNQPIITKAQA